TLRSTDASQECPIEITPDRMVVQYQGAIQAATCKLTSSNSNLIERYWQVENNKIYNESWYVNTRKDWDSRPVCAGTFVGLGACHKPLNLTLYKMPDSVFISPVQNLSSLVVGEELQLQCHIIHVAPAQNLVVRWYKGNDTFEPHIKDCDISVVRSPKNVLSTITITLDRKHNGAEFRCEAQMDLGPEGPQPPPKNMSSPLNITVRCEITFTFAAQHSEKLFEQKLQGIYMLSVQFYCENMHLQCAQRLFLSSCLRSYQLNSDRTTP
uniref:Ig-like domain-containing protein n=1 Tax=Seriola lalandi dorsalis TaxID=1841481 RepID=A0A3B4XKQ6_SERLL